MMIPIYALRDDGLSITCCHSANDEDHAMNKMRNWMLHFHSKGRDCNPVDFDFFIGHENYIKFSQEKRRIMNRI